MTMLDSSEPFAQLVQAADPLQADAACAMLPELNRAADVAALAKALRAFLPALTEATDVVNATAAMRDVGIFLGSIKRHGVEPLTAVPQLQPHLVRLGALTDMVPRDTIFHYTLWNPRDARQRMYTGDAEETHLIESVRMVLPDLRLAAALCVQLMDTPTIPLFEQLTAHLRPMVESMLFVKRSVSPEFFTHQLRPYLEDIVVGETRYFGPAAAQLPMWLFDLALWGARSDGDYQRFWEGLVPYALPEWRALHDRWRDREPLAQVVTDPIARDALADAIAVLVKFRGQHLSIAKQAYSVASRYEAGSGGGSVALLRQILDRTHDFGRRPS
jgi:monodechloroaminopyrrolnitrin synthase